MHVIEYMCTCTSLVLTAHVTFLLERRHTQTHKVTDATDHPTHASAITGDGW